MPKPKRKKSPQAIMIEILGAYSDGLLSFVQSHMPESFAKRHQAWFDGLFQEFNLRATRDGETAAQQWLITQLRNPRLPDFRKGKSLDDDKVLVARFNKLKDAMEPIFVQHPRDADARRRKAAPIVFKILQRTVTPQELPSMRQVASSPAPLAPNGPSLFSCSIMTNSTRGISTVRGSR